MTLAMSLATWQGGEEGGEEEEKEEERQAYIKSRDPHLASGSKKNNQPKTPKNIQQSEDLQEILSSHQICHHVFVGSSYHHPTTGPSKHSKASGRQMRSSQSCAQCWALELFCWTPAVPNICVHCHGVCSLFL